MALILALETATTNCSVSISKNGEIIVSAINKLERDGYDLTHVSSGLAMNGMITKIWMIKRK